MTYLHVRFSDNSVWRVPLYVVAEHRAKVYMDEFGNDLNRSLVEDTNPLFEDGYEVVDWASNNMDWKDLSQHAEKVSNIVEPDYHAEWTNAKMKVVKS